MPANSSTTMSVPLPPVIFLASITAIVLLHYLLPITQLISYPYNLLGLVLIVLGFLLAGSFWRALRIHKTTTHPRGKPTALVTTGPYAFTRNPGYFGLLLMISGAACISGMLSSLIILFIFFSLLNIFVIPYEERKLESIFGSKYKNYRQSVRRWI